MSAAGGGGGGGALLAGAGGGAALSAGGGGGGGGEGALALLLPLPPEEGGEALLPPLPLPRALSTLCCAFWSALPRPVPPCSRARRGARSSAEAGPAEAKRNAAATARRAKAAAARTRERAIVFLLLLLLWVLCGFGEVRLSGAAKGGVVSEERKGRRRKREGERVTRKVRSLSLKPCPASRSLLLRPSIEFSMR